MSRRKKIVLIIGGVIIGVPILTIAIIRLQYAFKEPKVIALAQEYLEQKYDQEMQYLGITFPIIEAPYRVCFSPADNLNLIITVRVKSDISLREESIVGKIHFMPDDYYMAYFELQMAEYFKNDIKMIWGDTANIFVSISSRAAASSFRVPTGLNNQLSLQDKEALIEKYLLFVNVDTMLGEDIKTEEAKKTLNFIQAIQQSGYKPDCLVFWYKAPKTVKDASGRANLSIKDWMDIGNVEQVLEQMDEQWFNK